MSAARLDAIRRIAEVNNMITQQELLRSELETKGLPAERVGDLIEILIGCRSLIEALMGFSEQQPSTILPPSMAA